MGRRIQSLLVASQRSAEYSEKHFLHIGLICVTLLPISAFVEQIVASPSYNTLGIRIVAGVAGGALIFHRRLRMALGDRFHYFWTGIAAYVLPFTFALMLLLNAAYTPIDGLASAIWVYQYIVALFFFVNLIHHGGLCIVLWIGASLLATLCLWFIPSPNWEELKRLALLPLPVYLTAVAIGSLMNRNVAMMAIRRSHRLDE